VARSRTEAQWNALSPAYRARLERKGITLGRYIAGDNLKSARGKGSGPEHPGDAVKNPKKYPNYRPRKKEEFKGGQKGPSKEQRENLEDQFVANFDQQLGHYFKYNRETVIQNAKTAEFRHLIMGINGDAEELRDWARDDLYTSKRNGKDYNPFWYH
jgi:hypothetical protein